MEIKIDDLILQGDLSIPQKASGLVIFAHGSGSSRLSPRNKLVANRLNNANLSTLLFDLLTEEEEKIDEITTEHRFDTDMLENRLIKVTEFIKKHPKTKNFNIGYFGASTGAAAALIAAAKNPDNIKAIVSRGGRPDLAGKYLKDVKTPTLLIVGGNDLPVIEMNKGAFNTLECEKQIEIVPGATHLFEEEGKLEIVADSAKKWFLKYLKF